MRAHRYGDYLGRVTLTYDDSDELIDLHGKPILLDQTHDKEAGLASKVADWKSVFIVEMSKPIGVINTEFPLPPCFVGECLLTNLLTDAILEHAQLKIDSEIAFSYINDRGCRAGLKEGNVSQSDIIAILPFGNRVTIYESSGSVIKVYYKVM